MVFSIVFMVMVAICLGQYFDNLKLLFKLNKIEEGI
jgi:hypothetical protein